MIYIMLPALFVFVVGVITGMFISAFRGMHVPRNDSEKHIKEYMRKANKIGESKREKTNE